MRKELLIILTITIVIVIVVGTVLYFTRREAISVIRPPDGRLTQMRVMASVLHIQGVGRRESIQE